MRIDLMKLEVLNACNRKIDRLLKVVQMTDRNINVRLVEMEIRRLQMIRNEWVDFGRLDRAQVRAERAEKAQKSQMTQMNQMTEIPTASV